MTEYHQANTASAVLSKIGNGSADHDFARAMHTLLDRVQETNKKGKLVCTVEVEPDEEMGCLIVRAEVIAKLPKLPAAASQMHLGPQGELLTQLEFQLGGGRSEAAAPAPAPAPAMPAAVAPSASGRLPAVKPIETPKNPTP